MPKKTKYRIYLTMKFYKDVEAESASQAAEICNDHHCNGVTYIEGSDEIYRITKPDKSGFDINKPNLLGM